MSVIDSTRSKHLVGAVFEHSSVKRAGKAPFVRECCAAYALQILRTWDDVSRLGDNEVRRSVLRSLTCWRIRRNGREPQRDAFHALAERGPDRAQEVSRDVDPKIARLLLASKVVVERPPTPPPPPPIEPPSGVAEGTRVRVLKNRTGTVRFIGETAFSSGAWVGVELDAPDGKHDGVVDGKRYFTCSANRGVFVRASQAQTLDEDVATSSELPRAALLCHAHKHLLRDLMRELQAQLGAVGAYENESVDRGVGGTGSPPSRRRRHSLNCWRHGHGGRIGVFCKSAAVAGAGDVIAGPPVGGAGLRPKRAGG